MMYAPLYREISPHLLVAKSRCKQGEASKKILPLGVLKLLNKTKISCLGGLNLFALSSVENFLVSACSYELAKQLKSSQDTLP